MTKSLNKNLNTAKTAKRDEFYTQLHDIEKELKHYKHHFKNKVVLCNCDDPRVSNFFRYFCCNFEELGLKKLITSCYKNQNGDLFSNNSYEKAIYLEYSGEKKEGTIPTPEQIGIKLLKGDGDFRSAECIDLLKQADIVVTNPPFSLFREFVCQLVKYGKKFLILGNVNAVTYKECFKLIKENKMWFGASIHSGKLEFMVPSDYEIISKSVRIEKGNKYISVDGIRWFTNLEIHKQNEYLILCKKYTPEEYPKYDNYDAINVDKTKNIPIDYKGVMGVPITFLDKYNPNQFEILGAEKFYIIETSKGVFQKSTNKLANSTRLVYKRIWIKHKNL